MARGLFHATSLFMKNKLVRQILSLLLSLQIGLAPSLVRAAAAEPSITPAAGEEEIIPPALQEMVGGKRMLNVPIKPQGNIEGVQLELGTPAEVERNRPSYLAKQMKTAANNTYQFTSQYRTPAEVELDHPGYWAEKMQKASNKTFHLTSQYFYFQVVMGLSALAGLAMNYEHDPIALQNAIKSYTSWDHAGESVFSFGAFLYGDAGFQHILKQYLKMDGPRSAMMVQQLGMGIGLLMSTVVGEIWNDKNIRLCATSRGTDLDHCDAAFDSWVKSERIVQYIPMIIQNTGAALGSAAITSIAKQGYSGLKTGWSAIKGETEANKVLTSIKKNAKPKFRDKVYAKIANFKTGRAVSKAIYGRSLMFVEGFLPAVIGLSVFMTVDAVVASPLMKAYTKNYITEKRSWLRGLKQAAGSTRLLSLGGLGIYSILSIVMPNYFPKFTDEKTRENWWHDFDLETFLKFYRLWTKYNIASRKESGDVSIINMLFWQPISKTLRESKVVDMPQDDFEIIRDAHQALLSSLEFSKKDLWQTYNVDKCSASLSTAAQLTFQQAMQFYIGLNKSEKQCIVDINIYDNLVSFIDRNSKHRNFILSPLTSATSAWMEALSKFVDMQKIAYFTYQNLTRSQFAASKNQTTYPMPKGPISVIPLTYEGVQAVVKENGKSSNHEAACAEADYACKSVGEERDANFLPGKWGSNSDIGQVAIKNNTDYIIAQMACGPDVKDTNDFWDKASSAQTYETFFGKWVRVLGSGFEKVYKSIPALGYDEFKAFDAMKDPNSAMIYTPAGLYPRFIPPRIVTGNGEICMHRKRGDNSVATGEWAESAKADAEVYKGLLPYVISHIKPEIMNNQANPEISNFKKWFTENIKPPLDAGLDAYQSVFNRILKQSLAPNLLRNKFTDGCKSGQNCFKSWKVHKVSLGVYQSMEVEIRVLLGLLNEIYSYPSEFMAKGRELDDKNSIATSTSLKNQLKDQMTAEEFQQLDMDSRHTILFNEATDTTVAPANNDPTAPPQPPALPKLMPKLTEGLLPYNYEQLKALEVEFSRSFRAKADDMSADKNGLTSFNVEQSENALKRLQMFFTLSRVNEINDLQAKIAGLIFRALEGLLQERNSYNNFLVVQEIIERKLDQPELMRVTGRDKLTKAFVKPDNKEDVKPKEGH